MHKKVAAAGHLLSEWALSLKRSIGEHQFSSTNVSKSTPTSPQNLNKQQSRSSKKKSAEVSTNADLSNVNADITAEKSHEDHLVVLKDGKTFSNFTI